MDGVCVQEKLRLDTAISKKARKKQTEAADDHERSAEEPCALEFPRLAGKRLSRLNGVPVCVVRGRLERLSRSTHEETTGSPIIHVTSMRKGAPIVKPRNPWTPHEKLLDGEHGCLPCIVVRFLGPLPTPQNKAYDGRTTLVRKKWTDTEFATNLSGSLVGKR
jgi:hypothetical protein